MFGLLKSTLDRYEDLPGFCNTSMILFTNLFLGMDIII
ncbi:hypothetical protein O185_24680 [Photorhabdus temperata J3]|uniref:Uncharacterized protein n=1 Tax=Photorhabdus temperata J3 TaxID=1389415 RepID=U7QTR7_PHOTE|nr:hypothetical protein O185_24680 [Photorhabdus temperata J3]